VDAATGLRRPAQALPPGTTYPSALARTPISKSLSPFLFGQFYAEELKAVMAAHEHSASYNEWNAKLEEAGAGEQRLDTPAGSHMFGKPSTGISLVYLLKELCGSLDVYGFGTHDSEGNPGDYKYYVMSRVVGGKVSGGEGWGGWGCLSISGKRPNLSA
jgi:hypothetical protein